MHRTSLPSASPSKRGFANWALFVAWSAALLLAASCSGEPASPNEGIATGNVLANTPGAAGAMGAGSPVGSGAAITGAVGAGNPQSPGGASANNPVMTPINGTPPGAVGSGGAAAVPVPPPPEPCVDVEAPPTAEWPDATCAKWATETEECDAPWFANYCDLSCGRCVPQSIAPDNGAGGSAAPAPTGPPPCIDAEPPPSKEWPDATCFEWANESGECGKSWFANYCNVSCGRCVPEGGVPTFAPDCSGENLPNVSGGEGFATRYWDCCQTHCAQNSGAPKCSQDGVSQTGDSKSACNGGGAYACYSEAPRAVSKCLAYGHIAKAQANCGGCYRIQFTGEGEHKRTDAGSMRIKGKQMIVKVSNTGGDVAGNQFDLMVPGGGVGKFNACSKQWGTSDLGARYGGFLADCSGNFEAKKECVRKKCMNIPAGDARDGCIWFVDWFELADNPKFTSESTNCPF